MQADGLEISRATSGDVSALNELVVLASSPFDIRAELERKYAKLWLARQRALDEIAGFVLVWEVTDEAHVLDLLVHPALRRRGIGRALLQAALADAREQRLSVALLEVRRDNAAAQALYRALGFEEVGERARYYSDGEDALLFRLALGA